MEICALVLAGGKSTRMNGNNKAFLKYKNKSFLDNILEVLQNFNKIYISVDNKEKYEYLAYELIEDEYKGIGPIGGIYSVLKVMNEEYVFVTACDMPKISQKLINKIIENLNKNDKCVILEDEQKRLYPLGGIYSKKALPCIEKMIQDGDYKLINLVKNLNGRIISLKDAHLSEDLLINVNNPDEYKNLNR